MDKKIKTERLTKETKTAKCEKAVSLRHGLGVFLKFITRKKTKITIVKGTTLPDNRYSSILGG